MLLRVVSIGAVYPDTVRANLRVYAWGRCSAGNIGEGEADAQTLWSVKMVSV